MVVTYRKHTNMDKEGRIEYLLINWDYEDGGDYLAKIFQKEFSAIVEEKIDYIYFSVIKLYIDDVHYELLWHEDIGNIIYSIEQDENTINVLETRLKIALDELNKRLEAN